MKTKVTRKTERNRVWSILYGVRKANEKGVVNLREFRLDKVFIYFLGVCHSRASTVFFVVCICMYRSVLYLFFFLE